MSQQNFSLPGDLSEGLNAVLDEWGANNKSRKLWARDASLWTGADESKWLGWLDIVSEQQKNVARFHGFTEEVKRESFDHVLLLGKIGRAHV